MEEILPEIERILSRDGMFVRWLEAESALAEAEAELGIIPEDAARDICANADPEFLEMDDYDKIYEKTGHPMVALIRLLERAAGESSGQYVHLGATTQDIIDIGMVLALKETMELAETKLTSAIESVCGLAEKYAYTPMIGRTHNVQALPITFGYKAAVWGGELYRCLQRLREGEKRILVIQLSGAVGSMVSFEGQGPDIQRKMAEKLDLQVPDICWHASRDRYVEFAADMEMIGCALGRIAQEVYLLMGTEIGELSEYWGEGRVGSSTMPHKVNPTSTQHMKAKAIRLRYSAAQIAEFALVDHERDMQHFIGERSVMEEICINVAELLDRGDELLGTLVVNEENMRKNLLLLGGLTQSERVMLELGKTIGKQNAHEIINEIAVDSFLNHKNFEEQLCEEERITNVLGRERIHQLLDPMQYIGMCPEIAVNEAKMLRKGIQET